MLFIYLFIITRFRFLNSFKLIIWAVSSEFGTYRLCEQRRFRLFSREFPEKTKRATIYFYLHHSVAGKRPKLQSKNETNLWKGFFFIVFDLNRALQICCLEKIQTAIIEHMNGVKHFCEETPFVFML